LNLIYQKSITLSIQLVNEKMMPVYSLKDSSLFTYRVLKNPGRPEQTFNQRFSFNWFSSFQHGFAYRGRIDVQTAGNFGTAKFRRYHEGSSTSKRSAD